MIWGHAEYGAQTGVGKKALATPRIRIGPAVGCCSLVRGLQCYRCLVAGYVQSTCTSKVAPAVVIDAEGSAIRRENVGRS